MNPPTLDLLLHPGRFAVCRLDPQADLPAWALAPGAFVSITRTPEELSVLCLESQVPLGAQAERGFRILMVQGPLDFALTGILAAIAAPLARAQVSIFAVSTFDTDYVLVKAEKLDEAIRVLRGAGHRVQVD